MNINFLHDNQLVWISFEDDDAGRALIRFQEHYEGPEHAGKIFTLGQYREWYARRFGSFSYYSDWDAYNVPDSAFVEFIKGTFDPLSWFEQEIVEIVRYKKPPYYLVATGGAEGLEHETCHAIYYLNEEYRKEADKIINKSNFKQLKEYLLEKGYREEVLNDECNAYTSCDPEHLEENDLVVPKGAQKELKKLYTKYVKPILK